MFGVRIHGRGGQGVVTAAELLSVAAFEEGRHAQAFPSFGSERTGAPVVAFCRISDEPIRVREPLVDPDAVLVQDATLLHQVDVFGGLRAGGWALVNSTRDAADLRLDQLDAQVLTVPASEIAQSRLGRPLPGAPLLGGLAALRGLVSVEAVADAFRHRFPGPLGEANALAAHEAYAHVRAELAELAEPAHA
jgi:pyruvate ferredoxin oxidoreductase gamma subunit